MSLLNDVLAGKQRLLFDGAMGTMLQQHGLQPGELPELMCLTQPDVVTSIHREYVLAGSQAITTNTFGANRLLLGNAASVDRVYQAAVTCARDAGAKVVAADIGPSGEMLDPLGDLEYDEAVELFAEQARAAQAAGADVVIIETMTDPQEAQAAVEAVKANCQLPVFATMSFAQGGRTIFGASPEDAAELFDNLQVDALGINCSLGPQDMVPLVAEMRAVTKKPIIVQANAGLPEMVNGEAVYAISPQEYAAAVQDVIAAGASIIGGCCGTNPDFIKELSKLL